MGDSLVPCLSSPDNSGILTLNILKLNCILYTVIKIINEKVVTIPELELKASNLQDKFCDLLASIQYLCQDSSVEIMKNIVRTVLQDKSQAHSYELIKQYGKDITKHRSVSDVFEFLINNNFIGYLNYQFLERFAIEEICGAGTDKASQKIAEYKNLHDDFVMIPQFSKLIEVFEEHPHLNPSAVIGLPILTITLQKSWKDKSNRDLSKWIPFVEEKKLLIQSIRCSCIFITYAIFPIDVPDVLKFLDDAEKVEVLRENGITMKVSTSLSYDTKKQPVSSKVKELPLKESCLRPRSICTFSEESHETFADLPEAALRKFSLPNPVTSKCCVDLNFI